MTKPEQLHRRSIVPSLQSGFTLVELMIAIAISLFIMIALIAILLHVNRTNNEMAKTNSQIENGRFAIQLLQDDLMHAGFWGKYVPQFDNLTWTDPPIDVPTAVPDPCLPYNATNWNDTYKTNLIGIAVQPVPSGKCTSVITNQQANTDAIVVRHAENCVPGSGNCESATAGKLYFQASLCSGAAQLGSSTTTVKLAASASPVNDAYNGRTIRLISGTGSGQSRTITAYDGTTKIATVSPGWTQTPDNSTNYSFDTVDYKLDTTGLTLTKRNCATTADLRKFISNIYYIRNYATTLGDGIPTLVRSKFDLVSGTLAHQPAVALVEGIEGFRVEYGIDSVSDNGTTITDDKHKETVTWASVTNQNSPTNRGDGNADGAFVRCPPADVAAVNTPTATAPAATACTFTQLTDVVEVKLYVLARSKETSPGYTDGKTYTLGSTTLGPFNDGYKRHLFSTSIRLTNVSGRRETP